MKKSRAYTKRYYIRYFMQRSRILSRKRKQEKLELQNKEKEAREEANQNKESYKNFKDDRFIEGNYRYYRIVDPK